VLADSIVPPLMPRARTVIATIALLLAVTSAHAADPEPQTPPTTSWSARLLRGTSPGDPASAKTATVLTLYGVGVVSLAGGVFFTIKGMSAGTDADEFARKQPDGFCVDRAAPSCAEYLDYRRDESDQLLLGQALFGASALFVLSGALTAELWANQPVQISAVARPGEVSVGFSAAF
jgi:hypothetical protein